MRGRPDVAVRAARQEVREHVVRSGRELSRHIAPAAKEVVAVGQLDGMGAILTARVDVRAAAQQVVDDVDLPGHDRPVNRLTGSAVSGVQELGRFVEQRPHLFRIAFADRRRDGFSLRRGVVKARIPAREQRLHLDVSAIARRFDEVAAHAKRIRTVIEQERRDVELILAHGEGQGRPVFVVGAHERRVRRHQARDRLQISRDAGAEQLPDISALAGRPQQRFVLLSSSGGIMAHPVRSASLNRRSGGVRVRSAGLHSGLQASRSRV